ncbi:tRNA-dihydrouridine synthase family protein [Puteibacter caeruleilacunae]|nr:tRNA-dihydrouridine synthase family protein [Puteibacter caeruleilacunae]
MQTKPIIHLAPLQGFTDFVYRNAYNKVFGDIDYYYTPYLVFENDGSIRSSRLREIDPKLNEHAPLIPQVLIKDANEFIKMQDLIKQYGYKELNINLGCPYPMVTNKGRGSGLLAHPERLKNMFDEIFSTTELAVSVKLRSGMLNSDEFTQLVPILNAYPFANIIWHPRVAKQLYKGKPDQQLFVDHYQSISPKPIYNGDINNTADYRKLLEIAPDVNEIMIGRGVLMNPFLPSILKGDQEPSQQQSVERVATFHEAIYSEYDSYLSGDSHLIQKMKQFWSYLSVYFPQHKKALKQIKKTTSLTKYNEAVSSIFRY